MAANVGRTTPTGSRSRSRTRSSTRTSRLRRGQRHQTSDIQQTWGRVRPEPAKKRGGKKGKGADVAGLSRPAARATASQLIGEMAGSGYRVPPSLVRRADGQSDPADHAALRHARGRRRLDGTSKQVAEGGLGVLPGRTVSAGQRAAPRRRAGCGPLGLLTRPPDGSAAGGEAVQPAARAALPTTTVTDPERTNRLTNPFALLFNPIVAGPDARGRFAALVCWWVLLREGVGLGDVRSLQPPRPAPLSSSRSPCCRRGFTSSATRRPHGTAAPLPGVMGAGVYLVWPAFYTDVTDSYRLGRVRTGPHGPRRPVLQRDRRGRRSTGVWGG